MAGVRELKAKLLRLKQNLPTIAETSVDTTREEYIRLNNEQLLEGKDSQGQDLTPSYFDDPFFKTKEAAKRYSDWKDRITPNPKRKKGTPNLFITGAYHNSRVITVQNGKIVFHSSFSEGPDIERKYPHTYGLSVPFKSQYMKALKPVFGKNVIDNLKR